MTIQGTGGYEFGDTNLGPEREYLSAPTDKSLAMQASQEFLGNERYPEHNRRMLELLDKFGLSTPGLEMAVILHDLVDHGLINPKDDEEKHKAQKTIYDLWDKVEDKGQLSYALGCALSAGYVEDEVGESWRYAGLDSYDDRTPEERMQLKAAIEKDNSIIDIDLEVLKSAGSHELDTTSLRHAAKTRDVEGFILKGIELLDNLDNPPADNPASVWRDCIEVFNCYSPALTFFGFKKLATELRGKALEFHYGGTEAFVKASEQYKLSSRHFNQINAIFDHALEKTLTQLEEERQEKIQAGNIPELKGRVHQKDLEVDRRIKTAGSGAKKLLSDKYQNAGVELLPDGIGYRIIVPDSIGGRGAILVGDKMKQIIQSGKFTDSDGNEISIDVGHPHPDEPAIEDLINEPRGSGYKSYHVVFMCQIGEDTVPFELQTVTQEQEWLHTWSTASEVLRKTNSEPLAVRLDDMGHMGRRSEHLKNKPLNRELIPNTWLDLVNLLPELKSPIHQSYGLVDNGVARIMAPHELKEFISSELDGRGLNDDIFLPPTELSVEDFRWMISQIDPSLDENEQIQEALELLMQQDLPVRDNGVGKLEGHLLPAAFHAGIMAVLSSKHWESKDPSKFLSDTVTAALLHDILEDVDKSEREEMKVTIRFRFGDKVADIVETMSSLSEIKDDDERRTAYAGQLEESAEALIIKVSDNMQNHVTDLAYLAEHKPAPHRLEEIKSYYAKTYRYLLPLFESDRIPDEYRQAHRVVMKLGKKLFPELLG